MPRGDGGKYGTPRTRVSVSSKTTTTPRLQRRLDDFALIGSIEPKRRAGFRKPGSQKR